MSTARVIDIEAHGFREDDQLLFDANVWLLLFNPLDPGSNAVRIYSDAYLRILKARSKVFFDVLVLSEFVNRSARFAFNVHGSAFRAFKDYRQSPQFEPVAKGISTQIEKIFKYANPLDTELTTLPLADISAAYGKGNADLNDLILAETCKIKKLVLVTHDGDFGDSDITLMTANNRLRRTP